MTFAARDVFIILGSLSPFVTDCRAVNECKCSCKRVSVQNDSAQSSALNYRSDTMATCEEEGVSFVLLNKQQ